MNCGIKSCDPLPAQVCFLSRGPPLHSFHSAEGGGECFMEFFFFFRTQMIQLRIIPQLLSQHSSLIKEDELKKVNTQKFPRVIFHLYSL